MLWRAVPYTWVCTFLREILVPSKDVDANGARLAEFIEKQVPSNALANWSVLLAGGAARGAEPFPIGREIGPVMRSPANLEDGRIPPIMALKKANILNPPDQYADFRGLSLTEEHFDELARRQVFVLGGDGEDLEILRKGVGQDLIDIALKVTLSRHARGEIRSVSGNVPKVPNGSVVRDMRRRTEGFSRLENVHMHISGTRNPVHARANRAPGRGVRVDPSCDAPCCARYSRAYLRYLFKVEDVAAERLATIHNLRCYVRLLEGLRAGE